jgi:hypothetical protein
MFDFIVIKGFGAERQIDIGLLAETLLFYQKVHLILDLGSLTLLVQKLGDKGVLDLLDRPEVSASFQRNFSGVMSEQDAALSVHRLIVGGIVRDADRRFLNDRLLVERTIGRALGQSSRKTERFARQLCKRMSFAPLPEGVEFVRPAEEDLLNSDFTRDAIERSFAVHLPGTSLPKGTLIVAR